MSKLTVENVEEMDYSKPAATTSPRKMSYMPKDTDGMTAGPYGRRMSRMIDHRPSIQFGRRMSQFSRSSISGMSSFGKNMFHTSKLQNTYRMSPDDDEKFNSSKTEKVMTGVLQSYLSGETYDTEKSDLRTGLTKDLSDMLKMRVKEMGFSARYKYVCVVTLGENKQQGLAQASRSIWNTSTDNFASASYTKGNLFAFATIFAMYFE